MKKTSKISQAISSLLLLLVLFGVFGLLFTFTNGFKEDFKTFYVSYNGQDIFATESKLDLARDQEHRFDVTYTFEFLDEGEEVNTDYSVKIVPNADQDFTFTVDGENVKYSSVGELTSVFNLQKYDMYFTLSLDGGMSLEKVLEAVYGKDVTAPEEGEYPDPYLYTLVVTSYDGSVTYYIDMNFGEATLGVKLDPNEVVF